MWILAVPAIVVAVLAIGLLLLLTGAMFLRLKWRVAGGVCLFLALPLLVISIAMNHYSQTLAFHPFAGTVGAEKADSSVLRVLSYNVWNEGQYMGPHKEDCAPELLTSVMGVGADVVMLCELHYSNNPQTIDSLRRIYPYCSLDSLNNDGDVSGQVFSRYPISKVRQHFYHDTAGVHTSSATWMMEINAPQGKFNFISVHLKTNGVQAIRDSIPRDSLFTETTLRKFMKSTRSAYKCRALEAAALRDSINRMDGPVIALGDFNDLSGSVALQIIQYGTLFHSEGISTKGRLLADAWWEGGFGLGLTYYMHHLHLRLDHILYSEQDFELLGVKILSDWKYSDHYPLVAEFRL